MVFMPTENLKARELTTGITERFIKGSSKTVLDMDTENGDTILSDMKDITWTIRGMDMDCILGKVVVFIKENSRMIFVMVSVRCIGMRNLITLEIGDKDLKMGKGSCGNLASLSKKDYSRMENLLKNIINTVNITKIICTMWIIIIVSKGIIDLNRSRILRRTHLTKRLVWTIGTWQNKISLSHLLKGNKINNQAVGKPMESKVHSAIKQKSRKLLNQTLVKTDIYTIATYQNRMRRLTCPNICIRLPRGIKVSLKAIIAQRQKLINSIKNRIK